MADPISIASGLLTLAGFALQSSKSLCQAVQSFRSNQKAIRNLTEELEALDGVLQSLHGAAAQPGVELPGLELPLLRCGNACRDFEEVIAKCTTHSGGSRTSFRDWAKLRYMGDDIVGFKDSLAGYKSTISIALAGANFGTATITVNVLEAYQKLITNTACDLEEHLQQLDNKLSSLQSYKPSDEDMTELEQIQEERESILQCLSICDQVSNHMNKVGPHSFEDVLADDDTDQTIVATIGNRIWATRVTSKALNHCQEWLNNTSAELNAHLREADSRFKHIQSQRAGPSSGNASDRAKMREEKDSIEQCLAVCAQATEKADQVRTNIFEDVSAADDAQQVITSLGDLITARRVTVGNRSTQWLGQMSDPTLQQLSRDRASSAVRDAMEPGTVEEFEGRYGAGRNLR